MNRTLGALLLLALATTLPKAAFGGDLSPDEAEIRNLEIRQQEAWNRRDAKAYSDLFAEDGDVVNVVGWWWKGRSEIAKKLNAAYAYVFRESALTITEIDVKFLTPQIAVAHVRWSMVGARTPEGIPEPRQGIQTQVLQKQAGQWLIGAFQNTNGVPERPFPTGPPDAPAAVGNCKPVGERTTEVGCWIITDQPVGQWTESQTFWHLDVYPTRAAAEEAKGPRGTVVESLGKVWLLTVEKAGWRPSKGERIAEIGPLPIIAGEKYSAQYMEAILNPSMTSSIHTHSGPEAWYTLAGETCLETPEGKYVGRAGGPPVIVPGGASMHLTATGAEQRRALVLILHETSKSPTTLVHDWTPKGLCNK
jgi:uncharacterized protein (TIGR02246 family)